MAGVLNHAKRNGWLWRIIFLAAGLIFGAGVSLGVMRTQVHELSKGIDDHEYRLRKIEDFIPRADEKLKTIDKIDKNVEEIKKAMR